MAIWPEGVDRRILESVDSTMSAAAELRDDLGGPTWVLAFEQTAGKGRRAREWVQPLGNFSATLIWRPKGDLAARAQRSFVAALALFDAVAGLIGRDQGLSLKWPNDVLLNGGKLAGILLESAGDFLSVGIGVNLVSAPEPELLEADAFHAVSLMGETGLRVAPVAFLDELAGAYAAREAIFTSLGFEPIRRAWLERAAHLGGEIRARVGSRELCGVFEMVDEQGRLVLKCEDGRHAIAAADVFF